MHNCVVSPRKASKHFQEKVAWSLLGLLVPELSTKTLEWICADKKENKSDLRSCRCCCHKKRILGSVCLETTGCTKDETDPRNTRVLYIFFDADYATRAVSLTGRRNIHAFRMERNRARDRRWTESTVYMLMCSPKVKSKSCQYVQRKRYIGCCLRCTEKKVLGVFSGLLFCEPQAPSVKKVSGTHFNTERHGSCGKSGNKDYKGDEDVRDGEWASLRCVLAPLFTFISRPEALLVVQQDSWFCHLFDSAKTRE